jgi:hypothetical protein
MMSDINIKTALYQYREDTGYTIEDLFQHPDIDFDIDVNDIDHIELSYNRYSHNECWAYFQTCRSDEEIAQDQAFGLPMHNHNWYAGMRLDVNILREIINLERSSIPYRLYVKFARKYMHIKLERKDNENGSNTTTS